MLIQLNRKGDSGLQFLVPLSQEEPHPHGPQEEQGRAPQKKYQHQDGAPLERDKDNPKRALECRIEQVVPLVLVDSQLTLHTEAPQED